MCLITRDRGDSGFTAITNPSLAICLLLWTVLPNIVPDPYKSVLVGTLLTPFYKWGNWNWKIVNNFSKLWLPDEGPNSSSYWGLCTCEPERFPLGHVSFLTEKHKRNSRVWKLSYRESDFLFSLHNDTFR